MQTELAPHPIAMLIPRPTAEEHAATRRSIAQHGLLEGMEIWTYPYDGEIKVLDGCTRQACCLEENVEPRYRPYLGDDPVGFALAMNIPRRNLNPAQRKKVAEALLKIHPEWSNRRIAHESGFNRTDVGDLRREGEPPIMSGTDITLGTEHPTDELVGSSWESWEWDDTDHPPVSAPPPAAPVQRVVGTTKSGKPRQAPGRKPLTAAEKNARQGAKPASVLGNPRDKWIHDSGALFNADLRQAMTDLANIAYSYMGPFQQQASEDERKEWLKKCARTAGFERAFAEVFSDF